MAIVGCAGDEKMSLVRPYPGQVGFYNFESGRARPSSYWAGPVSIRPIKSAGLLTCNASVVHILPLRGRTCLFASPVGVNCL